MEEDGFEKFCKLCQNKIVESDLKLTGESGDVVSENLDVFLLQINFNSHTSLICNACTEKLLAAFRFKSACLYTDDIIFPYTDGAETAHIDLKEIYMEMNNDQNLKEVLDDQQICRLCFKPGKVHFKLISEMNSDVLVKFLPEVNFGTTINPVICMKCHDELHVHSTFIRNCMDAGKDETTDEVVVGGTLFTNPSIKTEEVDIKPEPTDNETLFEIFHDIKKEENDEGDTSLNFPNELLDTAETKNLYDIDDLKQTSAHSAVTNYVSAKCIYKTPAESRLAGPDLRHKNYKKIRVNNSEKIQYIYIYKNKPKSTTEDLKLQKYNKCMFNTRHKYIFIKQQLIHKDPSKVQMLQCYKCKFKTRYRESLNQHYLQHRREEEAPKYEFKTRNRERLNQHYLQHRREEEAPKYKFKTRNRERLNQHYLQDRKEEEAPKYSSALKASIKASFKKILTSNS